MAADLTKRTHHKLRDVLREAVREPPKEAKAHSFETIPDRRESLLRDVELMERGDSIAGLIPGDAMDEAYLAALRSLVSIAELRQRGAILSRIIQPVGTE